MSSPLVTIITATTGREHIKRCVKSVKEQTYQNIEHIVVADGLDPQARVIDMLLNDEDGEILQHSDDGKLLYLDLPKSVGKDRYNGHRIYGGCTFFADGEYVMFLDDDNYLEPTHVEHCLNAIWGGAAWTYSFRNIVDLEGNFLCQDNCESLGLWPSVLHPQDYFVDVNCYFLSRSIAVAIAPVWFCKFREPGQPEIDRKIMHLLRNHFPNYDSTYKYTVNYTVGNTGLSVTSDFFKAGNAEMLNRYQGKLPWLKI